MPICELFRFYRPLPRLAQNAPKIVNFSKKIPHRYFKPPVAAQFAFKRAVVHVDGAAVKPPSCGPRNKHRVWASLRRSFQAQFRFAAQNRLRDCWPANCL
jgi:hypothetical protein